MSTMQPRAARPAYRFLVDGPLSRLAWLPIPIFLAVMAVLRGSHLRGAFESPVLLMLANFLFLTLASVLVVVLVGRSFLARGTPALLMLGCGVLVWGIAGTVAPALLPSGINGTVTVHNSLVWVAALCHLLGALFSLKPRPAPRLPSLVLALSYAAALSVAWLVTALTLGGWMPVFFVQGHGGTPIRSLVLATAALMFGLTAAVLWQAHRPMPTAFVRWYAAALVLVAIGLLAIMIEPVFGGLLSWTGRGAQCLAGLYMLAAALSSVRESGVARVSLSAALSEARQTYRTLVEVCPDAIAVHTDGTYVFVNPAAVRLFGAASPADLVGRKVLDLIHPDDRPAVADRMRLAGQKGRTTPVRPFRVLRLDGRAVEVETTGTRVQFQGRVAVQVVLRDVTETRLAEEALRRNEEKYRVLFQNMAEGFALYELLYDEQGKPADWRILEVNDAYTRHTGVARERIIGRCAREMFPTAIPEYLPRFAAVVATQKPSQFETHAESVGRYQRVVTFPAGKGRFANIVEDITDRKRVEDDLVRSRALLEEANRELEARVAKRTASLQRANEELLREMESRQRAEVGLLASEERYRTLVDTTPDLIYSLDRKGRHTAVNRAVCEAFGLPEKQIVGRMHSELGFPADVVREWAELHRRVLSGEIVHAEMATPMPQGDRRYYDVVLSPIIGQDGAIVGTRGISRDITGQRQAEEQLLQSQRLEAVGVLAGGVAHDFNNLLMGIDGYATLALESLDEGSPIRGDLIQIKAGSDRAAKLTRQLLAFSRKQTLQPAVLNLNEVARNLADMLQRLIGEDIDFALIPAPDLGQAIVDPGQMEQVIMNLAVNARDAMPQGGKLTIETANVELDRAYAAAHAGVKPGPYVMLAVTDTGCGMDEQTKRRAFEPFFTTKPKGKGTGLGLSTAYGIIKQSGGNIGVYSEVGLGTTFKIYLPRVESEPTKREQKAAAVVRGRGEQVLVVEDEAVVRGLLEKNLTGLGYCPIAMANGNEALLAVEEKGLQPALVVTDVVMPGMSGPAMVKRLRTLRPAVKVLYISGYTDNAIVQHGLLAPDTPFLQKPFGIEALARKVREVIEGA